MFWILFLVLQIVLIVVGIRRDEQAGLWSWSKFAFAIGFAILEAVLAVAPIFALGLNDPRFWWACGVTWTIAVLNFIWFIVACRRWKLPDGRTSLQADRDRRGG
jgi:hypothetical protein